jgi:hypothetical protein
VTTSSLRRSGERTGLDEATVQQALWALADEDPPFFSYHDLTTYGGRAIGFIHRPTGHARRTVGTWPTPEGLADRIIAALEDTAANAPTEEERSRAQKLLDAAKGVGKGVLTGVLIKVLTQSV